MSNLKRYLIPVVLGVFIGGALYAVSFANRSLLNQSSTTPAPEVVSCVKHIKVMNRRVDAALAKVFVEVENTSDLGVVAISLEGKKGKDSYTVRPNTFEADEPKVIIEPHARHTLSMELANISSNTPLQIGSVVYADGSEDGCEASVKATRESKAYHERVRAEKKGSPK
jgi:hypothetical protein